MYRYVIETLSGSPTKETQEENKQQKIQQVTETNSTFQSVQGSILCTGINPASIKSNIQTFLNINWKQNL